jgi:hypothetical protein
LRSPSSGLEILGSLGDVRGGAGEAQGRRKGRKVDFVRNNAYISDRKKAM